MADSDEMVIDTSRMSEAKRNAMEVAESARQTGWEHPSFARELFMGNFSPELISPFPVQSAEEKKIGDDMIARVTQFLKQNLDPEQVDETRTIPEPVVQGLAQMGLFAMKISPEFGGLGFSQVNYNRVMSAISSYCGSTAVLLSAHQSIGVPQPLKMFGTQAQKEKYLPLFREGKISAFALTEPEVGSDPARMSTTATLSDEGTHYILNGEKLWCTNGTIADVLVVMAQTEPLQTGNRQIKQITAFIVEKSMKGIKVEHRCDFMGLRGIENGLISFTNVHVPVENIILGKGKGLKLALSTLNTGRLTLPAACTGMAKQCLRIARIWSRQREQWGLPIGKHEAGAHKIAKIASNTFAMEAVTNLVSHWADTPDKDIRIEAAMAKLFCSELAWEIVDTTVQLRGGRGYEKASSLKARGETPWPVERMLRECRINRIIEGTSEIMRLFLAREAMDPHLCVAADLIRKNTPLNKKVKAGLKLASFYTKWYPQQWVHKAQPKSFDQFGELASHMVFVDSCSHRLARTMFHYIGIYQDRLERKQMLLGRLMDIGTELFAISATVAYAQQLKGQKSGLENTPYYLANTFAWNARRRIELLFHELAHNEDSRSNKLAATVLEGKLSWLESDIIDPL